MINRYFQGKTKVLLIILLLVFFSSLLLSGCGQAEPEVYRVGILNGFDPMSAIADGFIDNMAELGYIEGENITYDIQGPGGVDMQAYQDIAQKFVDDEVDLIMSFPSEASQVAKQVAEGSDVPVVFIYAATEGTDLVESIQAPGGNITGIRYPLIDVGVKRFEVTMQLVPDAKKVLIPYYADYPILPPQFEAIAPLAEAAGVTIIQAPVTTGDEMQAFLDELLAEGEPDIDAIMFLVGPSGVTPEIVSTVAQFSLEYQIPLASNIIGPDDSWTISESQVSFYKSGELGAPQADKIFQGIPAGTIPVVTGDIYLYINQIAADNLGLEVPEELLVLADEIFRE